MDFLSKKRELRFLNSQKKIVHVARVDSSRYDIWTEGKSKPYRDCVVLLENALQNFDSAELPPIIIVANDKIGHGGISSYNHVDDVIYFNSFYHMQQRIDDVVGNDTFAAQDLSGIIRHELGHKLHWDAVKRFYHAHKSKYNNIEEAKHDLDADVERYLSQAIRQDPEYLITYVSRYADVCFQHRKVNHSLNTINEVIAEVSTRRKIFDPVLFNYIKEVIYYGKRY